MNKSWRETSLEIIHETYQSIRKEQPALEPKEVLRMVSLHYYPFGERKYFAYKAWCQAMREYKRKLGLAEGKPAETPLFEVL